MKKQILAIAAAMAVGTSAVSAQFTINTAHPERVITVGVRAGGNVSNTSSNESDLLPAINMYDGEWKGGFTMGVVADLNIREYISIQPGVFYSSASHGFKRMSIGRTLPTEEYPVGTDYATATSSSSTAHYFQVPLLVSFKVEAGPKIKLIAEAGPYFAWGLGGHEKYSIKNFDGSPAGGATPTHKRDYFGRGGISRTYDWGFKMGVGVMFDRISINAHYLAGCRDVLRPSACNDPNADPMILAGVDGYNKMWQFTLGYNF